MYTAGVTRVASRDGVAMMARTRNMKKEKAARNKIYARKMSKGVPATQGRGKKALTRKKQMRKEQSAAEKEREALFMSRIFQYIVPGAAGYTEPEVVDGFGSAAPSNGYNRDPEPAPVVVVDDEPAAPPLRPLDAGGFAFGVDLNDLRTRTEDWAKNLPEGVTCLFAPFPDPEHPEKFMFRRKDPILVGEQ